MALGLWVKDLADFSAASPLQDVFLRKEVIQPQVPLRLPCYDFTPVADLTVVGCLLTVGAPPSSLFLNPRIGKPRVSTGLVSRERAWTSSSTGLVAQLVERALDKREVGGSSPPRPTTTGLWAPAGLETGP